MARRYINYGVVIFQIWSSKKGNALVFVSLCLLILFGASALAIDVAHMYTERAKMVTAADAGALAGAMVLARAGTSDTAVIERAKDIAQVNGAPREKIQVQIFRALREVEVQVERVKPLFWAAVFGYDRKYHEADIMARARAKAGGFSGGKGVVPIGIDKDTVISPGEYLILKFGPNASSNGNYHCLKFPGRNGASDFEKDLKYGYGGDVQIGQWIGLEFGNMAGPTIDAVKYRISRCSCTWESYQLNGGCGTPLGGSGIDLADCPRIIVLPVVDDLSMGKDVVQVFDFAAFFLKSVTATQGNTRAEVWAYYMGRTSELSGSVFGKTKLIK